MRTLLAVTAALTLSAAAHADDLDAVKKAITDQNTKYMEAIAKTDIDAYMALYTDDATIMSGGAPVVGKKARAAYAKQVLPSMKESTFKTISVETSGDLAYEVGSFTVIGRQDGAKGSGHYLVVWKKVGGTWKIQAESVQSDK